MGWFDGWFGATSQDPLAKLDPKLREFLERESPVKVASPQQPGKQQPTAQKNAAPSQEAGQVNGAALKQPGDSGDAVPKESLFQDGRYAHLWKTYRPLKEIESQTKTDNEKLMDVLEGFKERKAHIGRAALENCADEQLDWNNCMKHGDWGSRMTMCRDKVRKFEKCYMTQSRLLKALGYLSTIEQSADVNERIQMHADKLYHNMMDQEADIEKAKAEGREVPKLQLVLSPPKLAEATGLQVDEEVMRRWKDQLEKLPEQDRAAEAASLEAERRARLEMSAQVRSLWDEQAKEREARKAEGKETLMDKVNGLISRK